MDKVRILFTPNEDRKIVHDLWELYYYHKDEVVNLNKNYYFKNATFLKHHCGNNINQVGAGGDKNGVICLICRDPLPESLYVIVTLLEWI